MAGKQNEPNEKEAKAASGMKTETKPEQETETQEEKLVQASNHGRVCKECGRTFWCSKGDRGSGFL